MGGGVVIMVVSGGIWRVGIGRECGEGRMGAGGRWGGYGGAFIFFRCCPVLFFQKLFIIFPVFFQNFVQTFLRK